MRFFGPRILFLLAFLSVVSHSETPPSHQAAASGQTKPRIYSRAKAPPAAAPVMLTGEVNRDALQDLITFKMKVGREDLRYLVEGTTATDPGWFRSDLDLAPVSVTKQKLFGGFPAIQTYDNSAMMKVYWRVRKLNKEAKIAGVTIEGQCLSGALDLKQKLKGLHVDGVASKGELNYNSFNGHYNAKGNCSFGDCQIGSTLHWSRCAMNYDNFFGQNLMKVHMTFGDLALNGQINFSDSFRPGVGDHPPTVSGTSAKLNIRITKKDGSALDLANPNEPETEDDRQLRMLIAFWQINAYDIFSE